MKRALAFTLAVAVLASSAHTASATPNYKRQCGQYTVTLHASNAGSPESYASIVFEPLFPKGFDIHFKWDGRHPPAKTVDEPGDWATLTGGKAFLNGKCCKDYVAPSRRSPTSADPANDRP